VDTSRRRVHRATTDNHVKTRKHVPRAASFH
jgi:hypothetical protein